MATKAKIELTAAQVGQAVQSGTRLFGAFKLSTTANTKAWAVIREVSHEVSDIVTWNATLKQFKELAKAQGLDPSGSTFNQYVSSVSSGIREGILPEADEPVATYRKRVKDAKGPVNRVEGEKKEPAKEPEVSPAADSSIAALKNDNTARGLLLQQIVRDLVALSDAGLSDARDYVSELLVREMPDEIDVGEEIEMTEQDLDAALVAEFAEKEAISA